MQIRAVWLLGASAGIALGGAAKWTKVGPDMVLVDGPLQVRVVPQVGRVVEFRWQGTDLLEPGNAGSMFYPSPQKDWKWPPPSGFAVQASHGVEPPDFVFLLGPDSSTLFARPDSAGPGTIFVPSRKYRFDRTTGTFHVQYAIRNASKDSTARVAPWEVSRIPRNALVFFPQGDSIDPRTTWAAIPTVRKDSVVWARKAADRQKLFSDGKEGWIAAAFDGRLFVKRFQDVSPADFAPGEAEIELYTGAEGFEMEEQGRLATLRPGESLVWNVRWLATTLPSGTAIEPGNAVLVDSARALVRRSDRGPAPSR